LARTPWAPGAAPLAAAARIVAAVASGESADAALAEVASDRAAVQAIALGSIRWYLRLLPAIERLLSRPAQVALVAAFWAAGSAVTQLAGAHPNN